MEAKTFEVRDRATFIPVLAVRLSPSCEQDRYLLARTGYGIGPAVQGTYVMLMKLDGGRCSGTTSDPFDWGVNPRTMHVAHKYIIENFDGLLSGAVVDVEFILGITAEPKQSEAREGF